MTDKDSERPLETSGCNISQLIGIPRIDKKGDYTEYAVISRGIVGKYNSRQKERVNEGGLVNIDEANSRGYPPEAIRAIIKALRGKKPGDQIYFDGWRGVEYEIIAPKAALIFSGILPTGKTAEFFDKRHPGRIDWPADLKREFAGNIFNIDYFEQTSQNPEVYEAMLAVLLDGNGRLRLKAGEVEPAWKEIVDARTKEKSFEIDSDPKSGGTLWRFANLIAEIQKSI